MKILVTTLSSLLSQFLPSLLFLISTFCQFYFYIVKVFTVSVLFVIIVMSSIHCLWLNSKV